MKTSCEYCQLLDGYGKIIWETNFWRIYLAPSQRYLGTCVVALKRRCKDLSGLLDTEWVDFANVVRKLEESLEALFHPTLYNWSCFKNSVFRGENPEPEIHWHFIPRYKNPVEFGGMIFQDPDFGYIPIPLKKEIPGEIMEKLAKGIKKGIE
jgi:diadenosine tetraphosphate (Ap4A) HIT family hydrolase